MNPSKPISPFRLCSLLRLQKNPTLALHLFQNPNPNPKKAFRYTFLSYDLIITKLGRAKMFDEMEKVLNQLKQETRFAPNEILFCNVISYYGHARLATPAIETFHQIPSYRCQRTIKSLNSLLNALLKCRAFDKMREFFVGIEKYGYPDACTYNILIHGCVVSGCFDDGLKVFDEMCERGLQPDTVTFGTLIYGHCLSLRLKEAFKLKEDMLRVYGVSPNAHVYASLIKGLCGVGELSLAIRLKEEMVMNKLKVDSAIYSTLINSLFKGGKKEEVFRILEEMSGNGCKPDTVTYNVMINGFCKEKDFEAAYRCLDEMVEKGCKPDVISYNVILGGLCKEGKWSEATDLFEDMPRRGCAPDVVSYRIIFDGLCDGMEFKEAAFVLDEMIFKGYVPRCASIGKIVDGLCKAGNMDLLWKVLSSLEKGGSIDVDTWRMAVLQVCKEEKLSSTSELVDALMMP